MDNQLKRILGSDFDVWRQQDRIEIYHNHNGYVNQETYIKCNKSSTGWTIYESIRNMDYEIGTFEEDEYAICVICIICKGRFEMVLGDPKILRKISTYKSDKDIQSIDTIIENECNHDYFCLTGEKNDAICIEKNDDLYNVYYFTNKNNKLYISTEEIFEIAIEIVYEYAITLRNFKDILSRLYTEHPICKKYYTELFRYYLNK